MNLRGFDASPAAVTPAEAISGFLECTGVDASQVSPRLDARAALYRSLLADKRMLIVLDNARDEAQVRPLLPGSPACVVLVTSRNELTGLIAAEGACPVRLDVLTEPEAQQLLARSPRCRESRRGSRRGHRGDRTVRASPVGPGDRCCPGGYPPDRPAGVRRGRAPEHPPPVG